MKSNNWYPLLVAAIMRGGLTARDGLGAIVGLAYEAVDRGMEVDEAVVALREQAFGGAQP
jgi:hypothetical protein